MRQFSYYHKDTGDLHGKVVTLNVPYDEMELAARMNAPADHLPIDGAHDVSEHYVDVVTKQVIKRAERVVRSKKDPVSRMHAMAKIADIEARQARRVCELLSASDPRLKAMDEEIQALRADLKD